MTEHNGRLQRSYHIAVLLGDRSNPFWTEMERAYRLVGPEMHMEIDYFWADPEKDRVAQLGRLLEILGLPFDAIVVNPISNRNLVPGIMKAAAAGIPILDVGAKTDQESVREAGEMYHAVRTVDFFQQGLMGGSYICRRLEPSGGGKVAIMEGRPDSAQSIGRSAGAAQAFASAGPRIRLVSREHADFDRSMAAEISRAILEGEPDLKAFFCANDVMALGVADTAHAFRGTSGIIIVGVDLTEESRAAIREGSMDASVAFSPMRVALVVLDAVERVMLGERIDDGFTVDSRLVNKRNIEAFNS